MELLTRAFEKERVFIPIEELQRDLKKAETDDDKKRLRSQLERLENVQSRLATVVQERTEDI